MFSVGTSPLEIAKYLHLLWVLVQYLKEGAVAGFAQVVQTYEDFLTEAKVLEQYAEDNRYIQGRLLATQRLLHEFFQNIEEFSPHLGQFRKRDWRSRFGTALAKVEWAARSRQLEGLQSDLKQHLDHFMRLRVLMKGELRSTDRISIRINASSTGSTSIPQKPDLGGHFIFETACRKWYRIFFYEISSLESLHQWLLRVFDQGHAGRKFIQNMSYVLRNINTNKDILPSTPCPRSFRDIISANHWIEMSIIVSYEDLPRRRGKCPRCKTRGRRWYRRSMEVACSKCGLCIRFLSSNSTGPDPLTKVALDDIRANGIKQFFESQAAPVHETSTISTAVEMERWLESKLIEIRPYFDQPLHSRRSYGATNPWVFGRVVICSSQWPGDATWSNMERAEQSLLDTVCMLNYWITHIDAGHDLAVFRWGARIGAKMFDAVSGDQDLLRWAARLYGNRQPSPNSTFTLRSRLKLEGISGNQFHPPVIRTRCFLWLYMDILSAEANILQACSMTLDACAPQQGFREYGMFEKAMTFLFIPHMVLDRCSFSLVRDVVEAVTVPQHRAIPPAICRLVGGSRDLCFHYHMNGNLDKVTLDPFPECFFKETMATGNAEVAAWLEAYRQCLVSIIDTEGKALMLRNSVQQVRLEQWLGMRPPTLPTRRSQCHAD